MILLKRTFVFFCVLALGIAAGCSDDDPASPGPWPPGTEPPEWIPVTRTSFSSDYLNNRFFRLDLPEREANGRVDRERIDIPSIKVYEFEGTGTPLPSEITNVAAYVDDQGFRTWGDIDFADPYFHGYRWRRIELTHDNLMLDFEGNLLALDLGENVGNQTVLACTYRVVDNSGHFVAQVGDDPEYMAPEQLVPGSSQPHYRMKLLKARESDPVPHVFDYVLRNIYSLGGAYIDPSHFEFRIEFNDPSLENPQVDENGIPYLQIFGLDRMNAQGDPGSDGVPDFFDATLFDLEKGLLKFPLDFPHPFAAGEEAYRANVESRLDFEWEGTRLAQNQTPELYDPQIYTSEYPLYARFRLVTDTVTAPTPPLPPTPRDVSLERTDWSWAGRPVGRDAEDRVEQIRWFTPRERVLRRYLDPDVVYFERNETQPALTMYLRSDDGVWDADDWGGIMQGLHRTGWDLSGAGSLEIWINDGQPDLSLRRGRLHIDFGYIDEDGFWPMDEGALLTGNYEREDILPIGTGGDGIFTYDEDIGLDGNEFGPQRFSAEYEIDGDSPYPRINGTARNNREDDEDINGNTILDRESGYFTAVIDLKETEADVDVVHDFDDVGELVDGRISWRRYLIPLETVDPFDLDLEPNIKAVTHFRIWYEDPTGSGPGEVEIQISGLKFN